MDIELSFNYPNLLFIYIVKIKKSMTYRSPNFSFRESQSASVFKVWKAKRKDTIKKKLKAAPKKEKKIAIAEKKEKDTVVEKRDTVDGKDDKNKVAKEKPKSEPSKIKKLVSEIGKNILERILTS